MTPTKATAFLPVCNEEGNHGEAFDDYNDDDDDDDDADDDDDCGDEDDHQVTHGQSLSAW